jgi:hypothetical protein
MLWVISEAMFVIENGRIKYAYGTAKVRTSSAVDIPKPSRTLQALDYILLFILFGQVTQFRERLQQALGNRSENVSQLRELIDSLLMQWGGEFFYHIKRTPRPILTNISHSDTNLLVRHTIHCIHFD